MKININELVSQREAAEMRGVTVQAIHFLVKRGRFTTVEVSGKTFLLRKEVAAFEPSVGGRPRKNAPTRKSPKTSETAKRSNTSKTKSIKKRSLRS